jgi:hypothetical protein
MTNALTVHETSHSLFSLRKENRPLLCEAVIGFIVLSAYRLIPRRVTPLSFVSPTGGEPDIHVQNAILHQLHLGIARQQR